MHIAYQKTTFLRMPMVKDIPGRPSGMYLQPQPSGPSYSSSLGYRGKRLRLSPYWFPRLMWLIWMAWQVSRFSLITGPSWRCALSRRGHRMAGIHSRTHKRCSPLLDPPNHSQKWEEHKLPPQSVDHVDPLILFSLTSGSSWSFPVLI